MSVGRATDDGRNTPAVVFLGRVVRIIVVAGLLWYATRGVRWERIELVLAQSSWRWLAAAFGLVIVDRAVMAWRWVLLLRAVAAAGAAVSLAATLRVFFVSSFAGAFLPGSIGGDALRTLGIARHGVSTANAVASVAVDRLLGTVSVILMGVLGLWLVGRQVDPRLMIVAAGAACAASVLTYGLLFDSRFFAWLLAKGGLARLPTAHRLVHKFLAAVGQYGRHHTILGGVLTLSCAVQVLRTMQTWCLGLALGLTISGYWYFATVPVIVIVVLLPISIGGLGTANAAFVALFGLAGVPKDAAFTLSVLFLALSVFGNLPGGLLMAAGPARFADQPHR